MPEPAAPQVRSKARPRGQAAAAVQRVLTAVLLLPAIVWLVLYASEVLVAALAAVVALLALWEFFRLGAAVGLRAYRGWSMLCAIALVWVQWRAGAAQVHALSSDVALVRNGVQGAASVEGVLLLFVFGCAVIALASRSALAEVLASLGVSAAGLIFVALPFSYLVRLEGLPDSGRAWVLFLLCLIWAGDMLAYGVGRWLGRTRMAPLLSPQKTWEGAVANLVASLAVGYAFARWMNFDIGPLVVVAGLANLAGQLGDLLESAYKRGAGVKDSGALLPGHGGVLDRIDSLILAAPVVWCYVGWWLNLRA